MEDLTLDDLYLEFNTSYFPYGKRERIRKQLIEAGKFNKTRVPPLEIIKEKFEQEAHILNKTVFVDDGSEKKVYSSCVFENVKRYNCQVCVCAVYGKTALIRHNCSKKHYYMMLRKTHPHENFDENKVVDLSPGMKTVSTSDCYIVGELLDMCPSKHIFHVLIGLEYLVEVLDPRNPYYHCLLCNKKSDDIFNTMEHLESVEHRMYYLLLFFPKVYKKLLLLQREYRMAQLSIVVQKIEKKFGRLKPWRHDGALSLKQKKAIRHSIDSGPHIRDSKDLSFAEDIVFNEEVKSGKIENTVITEFVVNESEDGVSDVYERLKGGIFRCRLCRIRVDSLIEKITHPYTGKHLQHRVKGIAIYDSIPCQIQRVLDNFPQPLIGTEYIVEYDEQFVNLYHCMLCRKAMNNTEMVTSHLVSKAHRQRYIKHHMPKKDEELLKLSGPARTEKIESLLRKIEAKFGRLPPFGCLFSLEHKVDSETILKDLISEKIMDGKHLTVDEYGVPKIIYKIQVPLFPKEGQIAPEAGKKKKKNKSKRRSLSPPPKRRRSQSSSSSRSLSPVSRQRRLSPQPGPSTLFLPQEAMLPPVEMRVLNWLKTAAEMSSSDTVTLDTIIDFVKKCDEDNWENRDEEAHDCYPLLDVTCSLQEVLKNDEFYNNVRRDLILMYLKKKYVTERGWSYDELYLTNPKLKNVVKIMDEGPLCSDVCRPLCRHLVYSIADCVIDEFPEAKEMTKDEFLIACVGLVHISNWMQFLWRLVMNDQ